MRPVPRLPRQVGPLGLALSAYDVWRRLSPRQKQLILEEARKYGPLIAAQAIRSARAFRSSLRGR